MSSPVPSSFLFFVKNAEAASNLVRVFAGFRFCSSVIVFPLYPLWHVYWEDVQLLSLTFPRRHRFSSTFDFFIFWSRCC